MSFRLKIVLGIALTQTILLIVLVFNSLNFLQTSNETELIQRAHTTAALFASAVKSAVLASDLASLESLVNEAISNPDVAYARVIDRRGVLAQAGDSIALARPFIADTQMENVRNGIYDAEAVISAAGDVFGRVEIGISVNAIRASLIQARNQTIAIAAVAIAVLALLSYLIGKYLARGLNALANGTRQLAHGDLGFQIAVKGSDELAHTARAFNEMSREMQIAHKNRQRVEAELASYRDSLELLVAKRTEDLSRTNEKLQETNSELANAHSQILQSEKMASIGQLAAGVAHEINNPIAFVLSNMRSLEQYIEQFMHVLDTYEKHDDVLAQFEDRLKEILLVKQKVDLEFLKEDLVTLLSESNDGLLRVKKIVQNLKDFSHISDGEWQIIDIHHGIDSTLEIIANELKYKATIIKAYGDLPAVECMAQELNQVFMNLLMNAAQAIDSQGTITITTGTALEEQKIWIEITDTGGGIEPDHLRRIFAPFFTTKPIGLGTGLGLSISYGIVKKHHGRLEVSSELGKGSSFRIWLPLRRETSAESEVNAA